MIGRLIVPAVVFAACLAGCSLPGQAQSHPGLPDTLAVYRELSQCIRSHGDPDFPDPVVDRHGNVDFPANAPRTSDAARQACQSIADRLPEASAARAPSQSVVDRQKRVAQCMRDSGFPRWPDPNPDGSAPPPPGDYVTAPGVKQAINRCQRAA